MKIKISKASLKDHFRYYIWAYVGVVLITGMLLNLVVTAINSQAPPDKTLSLYVCGEAVKASSYYQFRTDLEEAFSDMELINTDNMTYKGANASSAYKQKFAALIASNQGDILVLPYDDFTDLVGMDAFQPLDELLPEDIAELDEGALKTVTFKYNTEDPKVYGIPLTGHSLFAEDDWYPMEDKVLVIMNSSQNLSNAVRMAEWVLDRQV